MPSTRASRLYYSGSFDSGDSVSTQQELWKVDLAYTCDSPSRGVEGPGPLTLRQPTLGHGGNARLDEEVPMSVSGNHNDPIPPRSHLIMSSRDWSSLKDVAWAVAVATEYETQVYVERLGDRYRWSLVHRGGPYPLLRITARFLQVDYQSIFIGCRAVGDGYSALSDSPGADRAPDASGVLTVPRHASSDTAESLIRESLSYS